MNAIIFDLDDTLYDYISLNERAMEQVRDYCSIKLNIKPAQFEPAYKESRVLTKAIGNVAASHNRLIYFQKTLEILGFRPCSFALEMYDLYWDFMLDNMKLNPEAMEILEYFHNKFKIGIATDLTAHIQHRKIRRLGIEKYIRFLVTSEESGEEKPSPRLFSLICKKLDMQPEQILFVGDSFSKDVAGASSFGMIPVWFNPNNETSCGANKYFEIHALHELKGIIEEIAGYDKKN